MVLAIQFRFAQGAEILCVLTMSAGVQGEQDDQARESEGSGERGGGSEERSVYRRTFAS